MIATIKIKQGDATTITETITGLTSLTGYTAKLYFYTNAKVAIGTITGTISGLVITYQLVNEVTKVYPLGQHNFETKIYDSSDHVYTPSQGKFMVESTIENDPS
jgi:hypothetical protein